MNLRWKKISEKKIKLNRFRTVYKRKYLLPHGHKDDFYVRAGPKLVCALVVTADNHVVIAKQFRPGPGKVMWEIPGGGAEKDSPRAAIVREVLEETGFKGDVKFLAKSTNDGWAEGWRYNYLITNAVRVSDPKPDTAEAIEVATISFTKLLSIIKKGQMTDSETAFRGLEALGIIKIAK